MGGKYTSAAKNQSSSSLILGSTRGEILDRNKLPLVNIKKNYILSVLPLPSAVSALKENLSEEDFKNILPALNENKPVLIKSPVKIECSGIVCREIPERYSLTPLCPHITGYTDLSGNGVCGLEKGYNSLLNQSGGIVKAVYNINAAGAGLGGAACEIHDTRPKENRGIVLTIDRAIQKKAESLGRILEKGAIVVLDINSGDILASASFPSFSPLALENADTENKAFFNRAFAPYSIGSTFKICVAAAALESGYSTDTKFICPGAVTVGDVKFHCHRRSGHWETGMYRAMAQSCNSYFIKLGQELGKDKLLNTAKAFGFGKAYPLARGITCSGGTLPEIESMTAGELANLSFGQGKISASPLQIAVMTAAAASGKEVVPKLFYGYNPPLGENKPHTSGKNIISAETSEKLRDMLIYTVEHGSGKNAKPLFFGAGGKTGSAQTGIFKGEKEIVHAWFTGFYPAEKPKYAITVLKEGGESGGNIPAKIFKELCDYIALSEHPQLKRQFFE